MPLDSGTRFGRYVIERLIGEGGMGSVYAARDPTLGRRVALKMLRGEALAASNVRERLLREARAGASLSHPNATTVYEVGEHDGHPYIAMEYLEGRTLRAFIGDATVDIETRLRWLADIGRALAAAHAAGLVHRDVKPENVMVTRDGVIKVLDFGITRGLSGFVDASATTLGSGEEPPRMATITTEGLMIGTPLYMAPEQMLGNPIDARTDQFAWGVTAFELLSGRVPWRADTDPSGAARLVAMIVSDRPAPVLEVAGVSAEVRALVARALEKNPERRFGSMTQIVETLAPTTGGAKRVAVDVPASNRERTTRRTWRRKGTRFALIVITLVGATGAALLMRSRSSQSPVSASLSAAASASASVAPSPTTMTEVPLPTSNAEALAAYRKGVQAFHDADLARGYVEFDAALKLDPALGAVSVRQCMFDGRDRRRRCIAARQLRSTLSERDSAILDATAPATATDNPDYDAAARLCVSLAARYAGDAEIALMAAEILARAKQRPAAEAMFARAIDLDPRFALAHAYRGHFAENGADATRSYETCLAMAPTAGTCIRGLERYAAHDGDCAAYEALTRRNIVFEPAGVYAISRRLDAVLASGARRADVASLVDALAISSAASNGALTKSWLDAAVAAHFGAFDDAMTGWSDHQMLLLVAGETGAARAEVTLALAVLADNVAPSRSIIDDNEYFAEPEVAAFLVLRRSRDVSPDVLRTKATAWLDDARRLGDSSLGVGRWEGNAFAGALATTPGELDAALESRQPQWSPGRYAARATLGHAALLGGKLDVAIELLGPAARTCKVLDPGGDEVNVFARVHARFDLGEALALKGETAAACASFAQVVAQWGDAKPRSVTAENARKRMRALNCPN